MENRPVSDSDGMVVQHIQYLPYGEPFVDQRMSGYNERFTFTGKERDKETGYGYFGARYIDHELMTMWLSVDPMADKYPGISPYAYCAWNPVKLVDPDERDFSESMEKYVTKVESFCQRRIVELTTLSEKGELSERQQNELKEFQSTMEEIKSLREDHTTFYDVQFGSFGEDNENTKGVTQYHGYEHLSGKGEKQHWIMVSLNTDRGALTEEGGLSYEGLHTLVHELKHCHQFYKKESFYIQTADGGFEEYNTEALEKAAFRRGAAFGSLDRYNPDLYPNLSKGTMSDFVNGYPGCKIIKHQ